MSYDPTDRTERPSDFPPPKTGPRPGTGGWSVPPPPPPVRRLVRDPGCSLGGVASGLSHHYGVDVSIIRLAFVLFTLISGMGIVLYILAWLIIPKGESWPPSGSRQLTSSLSNRELAIGAILVGVAMVVFVSGGSVGEVIVPLLLVGGGVWLLNQTASKSQASAPAEAASWPPPTVGQPQDTIAPDSAFTQGPKFPPPPGPGQTGYGRPGGQPGAGRDGSRRRRPLRTVLIGILALLGGLVALSLATIFAVIAFGDIEIDFDSEGTDRYTPATVEAIPESIQRDAGEVVVDLSDLTPADFAGQTEPHELDVDLDFGEVRIVVPDGIALDVDAAASLGDVDVFDSNEDGINPRIVTDVDDPDLRLDVNVGFGAVVIERP